MSDFLMPSLGADMDEGTMTEWLVKPGDAVKRGDIIAVVETQKGAIEIEVFESGVIGEIKVPVGTTVPVGTVLATIRAPGEAAAPKEAATAAPSAPAAPAEAPAPMAVPPVLSKPSAPELKPEVRAAESHPAAPSAAPAETVPSFVSGPQLVPVESADTEPIKGRIKASPLARRRAAELGVALEGLSGTGSYGAISVRDVEAVKPQPAKPSGPKPGLDRDEMRKAIAAAMARSKREIPHYYVATSIDMSAVTDWLAAYNAEREPQARLLQAVPLMKAVALALAKTPELNGTYEDGVFSPSDTVHLGMAVALRGGGLIAPAIHDVQDLDLASLMAKLKDLVARVRSGRLRSSEMMDPTITLSSLGDNEAETVYPIIYPPQVAIVGLGAVETRPWVADGTVAARPVMRATLAADHRVSDGRVGSRFLMKLNALLQDPEAL